MLRPSLASLVCAGLVAGALALAPDAAAQQPYPQQPPPPYPQQPYPQQQPYPPQQPYPQQYPPPAYPPRPGYPPPGYGYPPPQPPPPPPQPPTTRSRGEMTFLYVTSGLYGVGSGIWLDALFKIKDPGLAAIMPLTLGAAAPIGVFFWDDYGGPLHRGVPASIATGLTLGAVEGVAIAGLQWQHTREKGDDWSFQTQTTVTWIMATGGGVGGWAFGEWLRPDPRSLGFIASGAGWGAVSGTLLGAGVSGSAWKDGASIAGLIGYNVGIFGTGAISILHTPSWESQKYMWMGYGIGTLAACLVYPFYLFVEDAEVKRGLVANALGGLAGAGIAGALTWDLRDPEDAPRAGHWKPPFDIAVLPAPRLDPAQSATPQGAMLAGYGTF